MADLADMQVVDPGIDETLEKLTEAEITKAINSVLSQAVAGRLKLYLKTCVHCSLCADACHTYISRDKDPDFAPMAKVKDTLVVMLRKKGRVSKEFMRNAARIALVSTLSFRCVLVP